jgi:hypothetical protein
MVREPLPLVVEGTTMYSSLSPPIAQAIRTSLSPSPPIIEATLTWNETKFLFPYLCKNSLSFVRKKFKHHICDI